VSGKVGSGGFPEVKEKIPVAACPGGKKPEEVAVVAAVPVVDAVVPVVAPVVVPGGGGAGAGGAGAGGGGAGGAGAGVGVGGGAMAVPRKAKRMVRASNFIAGLKE